MYQYFFTKEDQYPFTLFIRTPRQKLSLSNGGDYISIYPVRDALVIMECSDDQEDEDTFLNMIDEVANSYAVASLLK